MVLEGQKHGTSTCSSLVRATLARSRHGGWHGGNTCKNERSHDETGSQKEEVASLSLYNNLLWRTNQGPMRATLIPSKDSTPPGPNYTF
jgi:hypothetical protein